jgi:hypothetical protein
MNTRITAPRGGLFAAVVIVAATGLLMPSARAAGNCVVPGGSLDLHHASGYDVAIEASGSALGPKADVSTTQTSTQGNITSGGITGRTVDFTIGWSGTLAYVHFTGTVDADGMAHGTSTATTTPVDLPAGSWDSVGPLTCS